MGPVESTDVTPAGIAAFIDSAPDAYIVTDDGGRIVLVNKQFEDMFGYSRDDVIGYGVEMLVPDRYRALHARQRSGYQRHPQTRPMGAGLELYGLRKDGREIAVEISLGPLGGSGGGVVLSAVRDITLRKRAQNRFEALAEITESILAGSDTTAVLHLIAHHARELVGAAAAWVSVPLAGGEALHVTVAAGLHAAEMIGRLIPRSDSLSGAALRRGRQLRSKDVSADPSAFGFEGVLPWGEAALFSPLKVGVREFGVLVILNAKGGDAFTEHDAELVSLFAGQASVALEYGRLREEVRRLAVVEERERIAMDLHDGVIQSLFSVGLALQTAEGATSEEPTRERLSQAIDSIDKAIGDLRNYIWHLSRVDVTTGLGQELREMIQDFETKTGIVFAAQLDSRAAAAVEPHAPDVLQITREALSNVVRHSNATTVRIELRQSGASVSYEIDDDGRGCDLDLAIGSGHGLVNLRKRVAAIGGKIELTSAIGHGTTIRALIPVDDAT